MSVFCRLLLFSSRRRWRVPSIPDRAWCTETVSVNGVYSQFSKMHCTIESLPSIITDFDWRKAKAGVQRTLALAIVIRPRVKHRLDIGGGAYATLFRNVSNGFVSDGLVAF